MKNQVKSEIEIEILKNNIARRLENDKLYAIKLIERIVFTMLGFILLAVLGALIYSVIKQ